MPNYFAPEPEAAPTAPRRFSSITPKTHAQQLSAARQQQEKRKPIKRTAKLVTINTVRRNKRRADNQAYYKSAEWRAKKKAVHERDGYRCVELIPYILKGGGFYPDVGVKLRCENMGMNINGQQTAKGLVCEETSYGHRGIPGRIDTCKTRCKECDRRLTPLERANHANGFNKLARGGDT